MTWDPDPRTDPRSGVLDALLALSSEAVALLDTEGRVTAWNQTAQELLGWTPGELVGGPLLGMVLPAGSGADQTWRELTESPGETTFHATARTKAGGTLRVEVQTASTGARSGLVVLLRPVAERAAAAGSGAEEPAILVDREALTQRLSSPVPVGSSRAVALLDVDGLALLNDTRGRQAGDLALRLLADRLASAAAGATFGRWEDDAFVAVIDAVNAKLRMTELMRRLQDAMRAPLTLAGQPVHVSFSAGLAAAPEGDRRGVLPDAAHALRLAKLTGRDRSVWFDPSMLPTRSPDPQLASALDVGLRNQELVLHYQPIVDLSTGSTWAVEALVRWERPGVGLVPPASFIELAEHTGQIVQIGTWVTNEACRTATGLSAPTELPIRVCVNLSARQLGDQGVLSMLMTAMARSGCPPDLIEIEVTETALMHDLSAARERLLQMKKLGVGLALDDFGTGYSSLTYLKQFPVDRIKIDRSFVAGLGIDSHDTAIIASTIAMAHSMGIRCIAEGVETEKQLVQLRYMQCDYAQGYLLSRPLALEQLRDWRPEPLPPTPVGVSPPRLSQRPQHAERILELHAAGASVDTIAAALNANGLRTDRGVRWSGNAVARVIALSHYPGIA